MVASSLASVSVTIEDFREIVRWLSFDIIGANAFVCVHEATTATTTNVRFRECILRSLLLSNSKKSVVRSTFGFKTDFY